MTDLKEHVNGRVSFLNKAWKSIEERKWKDVSSNKHSELSIIQNIYDDEKTTNFKKIFSAAQLREKDTPLVASLWNCRICWNIINSGQIFSENPSSRNLNRSDQPFHHFNIPLLFDNLTDVKKLGHLEHLSYIEFKVNDYLENLLSYEVNQGINSDFINDWSWSQFENTYNANLFSDYNQRSEIVVAGPSAGPSRS